MLINCRECGKQISDKATSCPACGCPVDSGVIVSNSRDRIIPTYNRVPARIPANLSTVDKLRYQFDNMDTEQQKAYLAKLARMSGDNPAYSRLLNEFTQKHNASLTLGQNVTVNHYHSNTGMEYTDYQTGKKMNQMALIGFIIACASILIDFWGLVGITACVFSGIGLSKFDAERENNKWMATTGLVLGIVEVVFRFFFTIYLTGLF